MPKIERLLFRLLFLSIAALVMEAATLITILVKG